MSFHDRSDALIELLEELTQEGVEYVLVGGYAVSAFNARFSTDLDIVVTLNTMAEFVDFLEAKGVQHMIVPSSIREDRVSDSALGTQSTPCKRKPGSETALAVSSPERGGGGRWW